MKKTGGIRNFVFHKDQNIALIGMPGCGKSTAGLALARMTGRPFVDIDERIEAEAGKSITEIFAADGEEAFRLLETRLLAEEAGRTSIVIATGGGVVTRQENLELLRQNSFVVYLKRDLAELITEGRPLSRERGVQTLAAQRLPLYEAWSDCTVKTQVDPELTAAKILEAII